MKIAIIGLGYVGLPLSLQFARNGVPVVGLDRSGEPQVSAFKSQVSKKSESET